MPRYFFHSADGSLDVDIDGAELADLPAARLEAVKLAGAILREEPEDVWHSGSWRVEVTDQSGSLLFTVVTVAVDATAPHPSRVG